ncbi:MAG: hypothetical protein ACI35W_00475 [Anaeroplasmataceae bacterium]
MYISEFLRDKNKSFTADEDFKSYLDELKEEIKTIHNRDEDKDDNVDEYRLPIRKSFIKKYPGFTAKIISNQAKVDEFKELVYKELNKLNISETELADRSNLCKQTLNKILNRQCFPNKRTLLSVCVGLRYTPQEAKNLLELFGYTFDYSSVAELIIYTALEKKEYDIDNINRYIYEAGYNYFLGSKVREDLFVDDDISDLVDDVYIYISDLIKNGANSYEELIRKTELTEGQIIKLLNELTKRDKIQDEGISLGIIRTACKLTFLNVDVDTILAACELTLEEYNDIIKLYLKEYQKIWK